MQIHAEGLLALHIKHEEPAVWRMEGPRQDQFPVDDTGEGRVRSVGR